MNKTLNHNNFLSQDYQVEKENAAKQFEQKHMVNWIIQNVMKSITPQQVILTFYYSKFQSYTVMHCRVRALEVFRVYMDMYLHIPPATTHTCIVFITVA